MQATLCGAGLSPMAPGTCGTIFSFFLFYLYTFISTKPSYLILIPFFIFCILVSYICNEICLQNIDAFDNKDPQKIVNDEFLGFFMSILFIPWEFGFLLSAFILFRIFDIKKPWLVSWADQRNGSFSIILDDLFAGLFAGASLVAINVLIK